MKPIFLLLLFFLTLFAGQLRFEEIDTTLLSKKDHEPLTVRLTVVLQGREVEEHETELMDAVQTVLGNFWAETLVTAAGKAQFKKMVVDTADRLYGIEVDYVYLTGYRIETDTLQKCLQIIREGAPLLGK